MNRVGFVMQLREGCKEEYKKRHDEIWPGLYDLLKEKGITEYSIFLHPGTYQLFGYLQIPDREKLDELPAETVMKQWWDYMKDVMDTNEDNSPENIVLDEMFYLP